MSRCLIIGCGLIGSHAARHLADHGHDVTVFSRSCNPWLDETRRAGIDIYEGEIDRTSELLPELIASADIVVHLASSSKPPVAAQDPIRDVRQMIEPALVVLEHLRPHPRTRLFLASSGGTVYGNPERIPTPEDHPLRPATPYAISHAAVEQYAAFYARTSGFRAVCIRLSNVFGPGELGHGGQGVVGTWLGRFAVREPLIISTDLEVKRDFLHVTDAAAALALLIEQRPRRDVYNVGGGRSISLREVAEAVAVVTGFEPELSRASDRAAHATGDIPITLLDTSRIAGELGWAPTVSFLDGVRCTWEWIQAHSSAAPHQLGAASHSSSR